MNFNHFSDGFNLRGRMQRANSEDSEKAKAFNRETASSLPGSGSSATAMDLEAMKEQEILEAGTEPSGTMLSGPADDDPFGNEEGNEVKYKTMTWVQTGAVMIAETISLGILSLPKVIAVLGLLPGSIIIVTLGVIATYTGYVMGQYKLRYPQIYSMADAGEILLGPIGRELFGVAQIVFLVFVMGSHILAFSIMMNVLTNHSRCTVYFMIIGTAISFLCTLPRTMKMMSHLSIISFLSVIVAILITMVGVAVNGGRSDVIVEITTEPTVAQAFVGVMNIVFAFAGHMAFFSIMSEMKNVEQFPKALLSLQITDTILYLVAAVVIYVFTGKEVTSPALGSTGPTLRKIAYGVAAPTIVIAGVVNGHIAAKYIYLRMFKGTKHIGSSSWFSTLAWWGLLAILWTVAWVIAESIPVFNTLLSLISSLFVSFFTYGISGIFWLQIKRGEWFKSFKNSCLAITNITIVCIGVFTTIMGLYSSSLAIKEDAGVAGVFSCADNSHF